MKRCPTCRKVYTQDGITFCLDDGAALVEASLPDDETIIGTQPLSPGRPTAQTMPPLMGIVATPPPEYKVSAPSAPPLTKKAGRGLGGLAIVCGVASFVLMLLGFVTITTEVAETLGAVLIVVTFATGLLGAVLGLLGVMRAVRNDTSKILPLIGFILNVVYLVLILSLLLLGAVASLRDK